MERQRHVMSRYILSAHTNILFVESFVYDLPKDYAIYVRVSLENNTKNNYKQYIYSDVPT